MLKMNHAEACAYVESKCADWEEDRAEYVRYCSHCDCWVNVDDYSGNDDKCDDC